MPRNMSFAMTTEQIQVRTKFVTRRFGWWFLKPGDVVQAVEKAMGLKLGQKVQPILGTDGQPTLLEIVDTRAEPLNRITPDDVIREGFAWMNTREFVDMLVQQYKCDPAKTCNRIEFRYITNSRGQ